MAETKHAHADHVEGDGISYGGIFWFIVILVATVLFCELFVWGGFKFVLMRHRTVQGDAAPLAEARTPAQIKDGRVVPGSATPPSPGLNVQEPVVLKAFRDGEETALHTYGWVDQGSQVVRLPIDRAKDLLMERGLPVRPAAAETMSKGAGPAVQDSGSAR
jgi:hypothetical protein